MKLYLVQHGDAQNKDFNPERPLTHKGHDDVAKMDQYLKHTGIEFEVIFHSGKLRAQETAEIFSKLIMDNQTPKILENINPNDPPEILVQQLATWNSDAMIVGHLPYLEKFIALLITSNEQPSLLRFKPSSIVCVAINDDKQWAIEWMIRPEIIT
jgi:phosphohistidine phosphatase